MEAQMSPVTTVGSNGNAVTGYETVFKKKNPRRVKNSAPDPIVSVAELKADCLAGKKQNIHGYTAWMGNGSSERFEVRFDEGAGLFVTAFHFEVLKSRRISSNLSNFPWLRIREYIKSRRGSRDHPHTGNCSWPS